MPGREPLVNVRQARLDGLFRQLQHPFEDAFDAATSVGEKVTAR
jgi:hypothetical protein